eukprot:185531-Prorocentrum_minimum.AAC.5
MRGVRENALSKRRFEDSALTRKRAALRRAPRARRAASTRDLFRLTAVGAPSDWPISAQVAILKGFESTVEVNGVVAPLPPDWGRAERAAAAAAAALETQVAQDRAAADRARAHALAAAGRAVMDPGYDGSARPRTPAQMRLVLAQAGGCSPKVTLETLIALLMSSSGAADLAALNPLLSPAAAEWALEQVQDRAPSEPPRMAPSNVAPASQGFSFTVAAVVRLAVRKPR